MTFPEPTIATDAEIASWREGVCPRCGATLAPVLVADHRDIGARFITCPNSSCRTVFVDELDPS